MTVDYGRDIWCTNAISPGRTATGATLVEQAIYRRFITRRGTVIDAPSYGLDLRSFVQAKMTPSKLAAVPGMVRAEVEKDERILRGTVRVAATFDTDERVLTITGDGVLSTDEPFSFKLAVGEVTVQLLEGGGV